MNVEKAGKKRGGGDMIKRAELGLSEPHTIQDDFGSDEVFVRGHKLI